MPFIWYAVVLVIVGVLVIVSAKNRKNVKFIDNTVNIISKPFVVVTNSIGNFFKETSEYFYSKKELTKQVDELTHRNNYLEHKVSSLESLEKENERLRDLLKLEEKYPEFKTVAATVISKDSGNYSRLFTVNAGKEKGIKVNQTVISSDGLVGIVFEVGNGWSKIETILDPASSVGCKILRTGDVSVTEGDISLINSGMLKMLYISGQFTLLEGDIAETSGLGGIYPPGIAIGRIAQVKNEENSDSHYAVIAPMVDFSDISDVMIITDK